MSTHYKVKQGDCIDSISSKFGFFPETVWTHPDNSDLKELRKDGNILQANDIVIIPDLELREENCGSDQRHAFKRKGVPAVLRIVFYKPISPDEEEDSDSDSGSGDDDASVYEDIEDEDQEETTEPIADADYVIDIDGDIMAEQGTSDGEGMVEISIAPGVKEASIRFYPDTEDEISFPLNLGEIDPVDTVVGVRKRLSNMGYRCAAVGDELDADLKDALKRFQHENELEPDGDMTQETKDKLVSEHGS